MLSKYLLFVNMKKLSMLLLLLVFLISNQKDKFQITQLGFVFCISRIDFNYFSTNLVNSIIPSKKTKSINGELFLQIRHTHFLKKDWETFLNKTMFAYRDKFSTHLRSSQTIKNRILISCRLDII